MSNTNALLQHIDNRFKRLMESIRINLITTNITSVEVPLNIEDVLISNGKVCTPGVGIYTDVYPQEQNLTPTSDVEFNSIKVNNLIIDGEHVDLDNIEDVISKTSYVSIFLNDKNKKFKIPFNCYISHIRFYFYNNGCIKINCDNVNFSNINNTNMPYKLFKDDTIKHIKDDVFIILCFNNNCSNYNFCNSNSNNTSNNSSTDNSINDDYVNIEEFNELKKIVYSLTGREYQT